MKHILEYNIFEASGDSDLFSEELARKFPGLRGELKGFLRYYLARGWNGKFDVIETPEGDYNLSVEFPDNDIPEFVFNALKIPKSGRGLKNAEAAGDNLDKLLSKDAENLSRIIDKANIKNGGSPVGLKPVSVDDLVDGTRSYSGASRLSNGWPNSLVPEMEKYLSAIAKQILTIMNFLQTSGGTEEIELSDIENTGVFKRLKSLGVSQETTPRVFSNGNFRISHPSLKYDTFDWGSKSRIQGDEYITVYAKGPIRITNAGRPAIMNSAPGNAITSLKGWEDKLEWVLGFLRRKIAKDTFGISSRKEQERISELPDSEYYQILFDLDPGKFMEWASTLPEDSQRDIFDSGFSISDYIKREPAKAAISLKKYYKLPAVKKAVDELGKDTLDDFKSTLDLTGGLGELGF